MGGTEMTIVAFGSLSMIATACGLLLRDILFGGQADVQRSARRRPTVYDAPVNRSLLGKFDQGFERLVLDTGLAISPLTGFLVLVTSGLLVGGAIGLYAQDALLTIAGALIGMILPLLYFSIKRRQRQQEIRRQLPSVIDMLARSTRSGLSIEQAIAIAAEESQGDIRNELLNLSKSLQLGWSFEKAIQAFARRLLLVEVRILATTLTVQRQSGGHLSETLERLSRVIRDRIAIQGQVRATTGAGRISTAIIAMLAPIGFIAIMMLNPAHLRILQRDPLGQMLLAIGIGLEVLGLLWVFFLLRNDN